MQFLIRRHSIQNIEQNWKLKAKDAETRKTKTQKDENLVLPKEQVENADLYKPVLNKIMTTCKKYIKYNFVAPLI